MYDFFEISVHNMAKGCLINWFIQRAYIHDLKGIKFGDIYEMFD